jgi:hypothetical protein
MSDPKENEEEFVDLGDEESNIFPDDEKYIAPPLPDD